MTDNIDLKASKTTDLDWMDEPIKADAWRNLYFDTDGNSYLGKLTHKDESAALEHGNRIKNLIEDSVKNGQCHCVDFSNGYFFWSDKKGIPVANYSNHKTKVLSHIIQIPVKSN